MPRQATGLPSRRKRRTRGVEVEAVQADGHQVRAAPRRVWEAGAGESRGLVTCWKLAVRPNPGVMLHSVSCHRLLSAASSLALAPHLSKPFTNAACSATQASMSVGLLDGKQMAVSWQRGSFITS